MEKYKTIIATAIITTCVLVSAFFAWRVIRLENTVGQIVAFLQQAPRSNTPVSPEQK